MTGTYFRPADHEDRIDIALASLAAHFGSEVVAVLGTAARIHGLPQPWPDDGLVHIALPPGREQAQIPGTRIHTWILRDDEIVGSADMLHTNVERTLVDLMCTVDRLSAVASLDAALHLHLVEPDQILELERTTRRRRGAARSRPWWRTADGRAESPLESRIRLRAADGGYPPAALQQPFTVRHRRYYADFAWRQPNNRWLIGEADGRAFHETPDAVLADRHRSNDLVGLGDIDLVRFTWGDSLRPATVPDVLSRFLGPALP